MQCDGNMSRGSYDISVVIPFADDEEVIGRAVRRVASHLRELSYSFEILCVDEDSGDNSHAVLSLLRSEVTELEIGAAPGRGRGAAAGAAVARGRVVCVVSPKAALQTLAPLDRAVRQVITGGLDLVVVDGRFSVSRRARVAELLASLRGHRNLHERLARRAKSRGLRVERHRLGGSGPNPGTDRPWSRLFGAAPIRAALTLFDGDS